MNFQTVFIVLMVKKKVFRAFLAKDAGVNLHGSLQQICGGNPGFYITMETAYPYNCMQVQSC